MGRFRGGPAKVAVIASAFFGSVSGSAIAKAGDYIGEFTVDDIKSADQVSIEIDTLVQ